MYDNLNGVGRHSYIPEEAFLFMPTYSGSDQVNDDFKIGDGKRTRRLIFEGWASDTYT